MRDTPYAKELVTANFVFPDGDEGRIERLYVKELQQDEIRFSWWKDGKMMMRPLDLREDELLPLLANAIEKGVFSEAFLKGLKALLGFIFSITKQV